MEKKNSSAVSLYHNLLFPRSKRANNLFLYITALRVCQRDYNVLILASCRLVVFLSCTQTTLLLLVVDAVKCLPISLYRR